MFGVRDEAVHDEGVHEPKKCWLYVCERVKMSTDSDAVFCRENGVRGICLHDPVKQQLEEEGRRLDRNTHKRVPGFRYTASTAQKSGGLVTSNPL